MSESDQNLNKGLSQWAVDSELPADFKRRVWGRISQSRDHSASFGFEFYFRWVVERLHHRAGAVAFLLVAALVGGGLGGVRAKIDSKGYHLRMAESYLQTIDPSRHSLE